MKLRVCVCEHAFFMVCSSLNNKPFLYSSSAAFEGKTSGKRSRLLDSDDDEDERGTVKYF